MICYIPRRFLWFFTNVLLLDRPLHSCSESPTHPKYPAQRHPMNFYDLHNQTLPSLFSPDLPLDFVLAHDSPTPPFLGLVIFFRGGFRFLRLNARFDSWFSLLLCAWIFDTLYPSLLFLRFR